MQLNTPRYRHIISRKEWLRRKRRSNPAVALKQWSAHMYPHLITFPVHMQIECIMSWNFTPTSIKWNCADTHPTALTHHPTTALRSFESALRVPGIQQIRGCTYTRESTHQPTPQVHRYDWLCVRSNCKSSLGNGSPSLIQTRVNMRSCESTYRYTDKTTVQAIPLHLTNKPNHSHTTAWNKYKDLFERLTESFIECVPYVLLAGQWNLLYRQKTKWP